MALVLFSICIGQTKLKLDFGTVCSSINFDWSIAGDEQGKNPNILSELSYDDILSLGFYINLRYRVLQRCYFTLKIENAEHLKGKGSDIDYIEDNRLQPSYELNFESNKGCSQQLKSGVQFEMYKIRGNIVSIGSSYINSYHLFSMTSKNERSLDTWYSTREQGIDFNVKATIDFKEKVYINGSFIYDIVSYKAIGNWNLIPAFRHPISFMQESNGKNLTGIITIKSRISKDWFILLEGSFINKNIRKGTDEAYLSNGTTHITQFNGANGMSKSIKLGILANL